MVIKKTSFSTCLCDLYGSRTDEYAPHITVGREYWYYFTKNATLTGWFKIRITYIRSGIAFYVFSDLPDVPEDSFPLSSFLASRLEFAEIDPVADVIIEEKNVDYMQARYRFDDTRTIVKNWDNSKESEIEDDKIGLDDYVLGIAKLTDYNKDILFNQHES